MKNNNAAYASIIIASYNEKKYIGNCLDSIIENDFPKDRLEVLVIDGMSDDGTRDIVKAYSVSQPFIKLLDNPKKITPCAFNIGIQNSKGNVVIIMGSHSTYEKNYISECVKYLNKYNADNVGGIIKTLPGDKTPAAESIALALTHPFGVGNSTFRVGSKEPQWVDTVFGGCYNKEVFDKIGMFNENLLRSQDMDFNIRLKNADFKILLVPSIVSTYYAKSTLLGFLIHNLNDGIWSILPLKFGSSIFKIRHLLPLFFILSILGSLLLSVISNVFFYLFLGIILLYMFINLYSSLTLSLRERKIRYLFFLPFVFISRHFGYGFGSLWGLVKLIF